MKKTMKKIAAVGVAAVMSATAFTGVSAANLADLPAPFIKDGQADFTMVIGGPPASPEDTIGALDIAFAMQALSVEEVALPGTGGTTTTVEGGYALSTRSTPLVLQTPFNLGRAVLRDTQLPNLLADGVTRIGNSNYDYTQSLRMGARYVDFQQLDDVPTLLVDLSTSGSRQLWNYTLDIDPVNITNLGRAETIEILGKSFTFSPDMRMDDDLVLYASEVTTSLGLNNPQTVQTETGTYTLEIVGANTDDGGSIVLDVNGNRRTLEAAETQTIGGLEVFVEDVFVTNVPSLDASAVVFVGSQEVEIRANQGMSDVEINNQRVAGLQANATIVNGELEEINFAFYPYNLRNDVDGFDRVEQMLPGDSITDPLFGTFEVTFDGMTQELRDSAKAHVSIEASRDEYQLRFEDYYGNTVEFVPFTYDESTDSLNYTFVAEGEGFGQWDAEDEIPEDAIFALHENFNTEDGTKLYEVVRIRWDGSSSASGTVVELRDMSTRSVRSYRVGDRIGDSGASIHSIHSGEEYFTLSGANTAEVLYLKGGKASLTLSNETWNNTTKTLEDAITITEDNGQEMTLDLRKEDGEDAQVRVADSTFTENARNRNTDEQWYLSAQGTFAVVDTDDREVFDAWVVTDEDHEVEFSVFVAPTGATVRTTGVSGDTAQIVNPIGVGRAVLDTEINLATTQTNLIVVGGPAINSVAEQLLTSTLGAENVMQPFSEPGDAIVELFELDNGRMAMLVAGYDAKDTRAATRAVALMDEIRAVSGSSATIRATSATSYTVQ